MDAHIRKVYVSMTETAFYILWCLQSPNHGYGVVQTVERLTDGAIKLAPGTMYGSLAKMEKDGLIRFVREEEKRKLYERCCKRKLPASSGSIWIRKKSRTICAGCTGRAGSLSAFRRWGCIIL